MFKTADWVKSNIKYDLSTLTAKVSQSASWTLANKQGVCDEITTLFIAFLRSLGIPARFVSGVAYTDSPLFPNAWGAHGWAEVYFPSVGWVPYDVTYGEFGFVDASHIILKISADSDESASQYKWSGRNIDLITGNLNIDASLVSTIKNPDKFISLKTTTLQDKVGLGSYNIIKVQVKNLKDSYISTTLSLAKVPGMINKNNQRSIWLKPLESKEMYWLVQVSPNLDTNFVYTFPSMVYSLRNTSSSTSFKASEKESLFSKEQLSQYLSEKKKESKKEYSKNIIIDCTQDKKFYYTYDSPKIICSVKNSGTALVDLKICLKDECHTASLKSSQMKSYSYYLLSPTAGVNKIPVIVSGSTVSKSYFYDLTVLDIPKISIEQISCPAKIGFRQPYTLEFLLKKHSASEPFDIDLKLDIAGHKRDIDVSSLTSDKKFILNMDSVELNSKPNKILINLSYTDMNNRHYNLSKQLLIELENLSLIDRMEIFLRNADKWLRNLFKQ